MNRQFNTEKRWFYRPLRVVAAIMTAFVGIAISATIVTALIGDLEMLNDFVEMESEITSLSNTAKVGLGLINIFALLTFWLLFSSIRTVLIYAERNELLQDSAEKALMKMGYAMLMLYFVFMSTDILIPILADPSSIYENLINFFVYLIDLNALTLLIGMVLMALSGALREGRIVRDELKQIV